MDFVNNYSAPIAISAATTSAALALPDGVYTLTIAAGVAATSWEIVGAEVVAGTATLTRGLEGTAAADWPDGSVIYCALTAGVLAGLASSGPGAPSVRVDSADAVAALLSDDFILMTSTASGLTITLPEVVAGYKALIVVIYEAAGSRVIHISSGSSDDFSGDPGLTDGTVTGYAGDGVDIAQPEWTTLRLTFEKFGGAGLRWIVRSNPAPNFSYIS
jgi:hypothetical protein